MQTAVSGAPTIIRAARDRIRHQTGFRELTDKIQAAGLLERRYGFYWSMMAGAVAAFVAIGIGMVLLGDSWYQLILAGILGVVLSQIGFLGHEAAHRQMFRSPHWNEWVARVLSTLMVGLSYGWWMNKHNRHHANPNKQGTDPDVDNKFVALTPVSASLRKGLTERLGRVQGFFFLPLLLLEGMSLHVASVQYLFRRGTVKRRPVEIAFMVTRIVGWPVFLFIFFPPGLAAAFLGVQLAVFGFLLGAAFAPNHIAMPIVPPDSQVDFVRRQVVMSRNISGGPLVRFFMGGLENQVEHHLFPMMARPNLKRAQQIVREHCQQHGIPYTETTLRQSYATILRYLNQVGLTKRGSTFACPLVQFYRV